MIELKIALYLIDTATDKLTKFDSSEADYTLVGWYDHSFIYALSLSNRRRRKQDSKLYEKLQMPKHYS